MSCPLLEVLARLLLKEFMTGTLFFSCLENNQNQVYSARINKTFFLASCIIILFLYLPFMCRFPSILLSTSVSRIFVTSVPVGGNHFACFVKILLHPPSPRSSFIFFYVSWILLIIIPVPWWWGLVSCLFWIFCRIDSTILPRGVVFLMSVQTTTGW
jgi:hypothetical protein